MNGGFSGVAPAAIIPSAGIFPLRLPVVVAGTTPVYSGVILSGPFGNQTPIPDTDLSSVTLSIVNKATGLIINSCSQVNILNTGRGTEDANGNITVSLLAADTSLTDTPSLAFVVRSLEIDWTYNLGASSGSREVDFIVMAGPAEPPTVPAQFTPFTEFGWDWSLAPWWLWGDIIP